MSNVAAPSAQTVAVRPFYRRRFFVAVLNLFVSPVALLILWSGPVYFRRKGEIQRVRLGEKLLLTGVGVMSLVYWCNQLAGSSAAGALPSCNSAPAISTLKQAVERSPAGRLHGLELLSVKQVREVAWSDASQIRQCSAAAELNDTSTHSISFKLSWDDRKKGLWLIEYSM